DGFDRLTKVAGITATGCPTAATTTYAYDGLDRQRSHNEGSGATVLHYDGLSSNASDETSTAGIDTVYGLTPHGLRRGLTVETAKAPTTEYLVDNGTGDITTTSTTAAAVKCTARFDPFGNPVGAQSGTNSPCA